MAIEGAALSHLRDAYYALTHDLADVDLTNDDLSFDAGNNVDGIARVVTGLAVTMMRFGLAVEAADALIKSGRRAATVMLVIVALLLIIVVAACGWGLYEVCKSVATGGADYFSGATRAGLVILAGIGATAFVASWVLMLRDRRRRLDQERVVLQAGYWRLHRTVSRAYAMRYEVAVQIGSVSEFILSQNDDDDDLAQQADCSNPAPGGGTTCNNQINPCDPTLPTLASVIRASCAGEISVMLKELQAIKVDGIASFDRMALWKAISGGVTAIRRTIAVSADADTAVQPMQAQQADAVIKGQIVPALEVFSTMTDDVEAILKSNAHALTPADAAAVSSALKASYGGAYASLQPNLDKVLAAVTTASAVHAQPEQPEQPVVDAVIAAMDAFPSILIDNRAKITANILHVLQSNGYQIDLTDYRDTINDTLQAYYGAAYPTVGTALGRILDDAQSAADARLPSAAAKYVDAATLTARIEAMGPGAWADLVVGTDATQRAVQTFLTKFPPGSSTLGVDLACMAVRALMVAGFVALMLYVVDRWSAIRSGDVPAEVGARAVIIATCLFALAIVCLSAMSSRKSSAAKHDAQAIVRNGHKLLVSLGTVETASAAIQAAPPGTKPDPIKAQAYITAASAAVGAYDACNAVTNGSRTLPFPMLDLIVYGSVVVVVVASALYGVQQLAPGQKVANIRTLMRLRDRILDGEVPPGMAAQLQCCSPDHSVWNILMWLSVIVLLCMNGWVLANVQNADQAYALSLQLLDDCTAGSTSSADGSS